MRLVEVINSTPEPDGIHKSYYLSIPRFDERGDEILTPAHAVAWTFSMTPEDYRTQVETSVGALRWLLCGPSCCQSSGTRLISFGADRY